VTAHDACVFSVGESSVGEPSVGEPSVGEPSVGDSSLAAFFAVTPLIG
jgi:hypothetical protein